MALVGPPSSRTAFSDEEGHDERLRSSIRGRLRDAGLCKLPDDRNSSLLRAMVDAARLFVADTDDGLQFERPGLLEELRRILKEYESLQLGSINDVLLPALGEVLHYAVEMWTRGGLKGTSTRYDPSDVNSNPSFFNYEQFIDHPIDSQSIRDEEKPIPLLSVSSTDDQQEVEEIEIEREDARVEGVFPDVESVIEPAEYLPSSAFSVKREINYSDPDDFLTDDYSQTTGGEEPSSESSRQVLSSFLPGKIVRPDPLSGMPSSDPPSLNKGHATKTCATKNRNNAASKIRPVTRVGLAVLNPADYEVDEGGQGGRKFKCTQCGLRYMRTSALICHVNSHTGDKPYPCSSCPKKFASSTARSRHSKTSHKGKQKKSGVTEKKSAVNVQKNDIVKKANGGNTCN